MVRLSKVVGLFLFLGITILLGCEGGQSEALLDDLLEAEAERDDYKSELTQQAIELETLSSKLNQLNLDLQSLQIKKETLLKEKKIVEDELETIKKRKKELEAELIQVKNELRPQEHIQKEKELLEKDLERITKELDEATRGLDALNINYTKLSADYKEITEKLISSEAANDSLLNRKPKTIKILTRSISVSNYFHIKNVQDAVKTLKFDVPKDAKEIRIAGSFTSTYSGVTALIRDKPGLDSLLKHWNQGKVDKIQSNWVVNDVKTGRLLDMEGLRNWAGHVIFADKLKKPLKAGETYYLIFRFFNDDCQGFLCLGDKVATTTITGTFTLSYF